MPPAKDVWVLAERKQGRLEGVCLEITSKGRQLADELGEEVKVVAIGGNNEELVQTLASYGADRIYFVDSPLLSQYSAELYVAALSKLFEDENPRIVLCGATPIGRDLTPRLAGRLKTGLVSECISLALNEEGLLLQTKLTYGGKVSSTIVCPASRPQIATVKPGAMAMAKPNTTRKAEVTTIAPRLEGQEPRTNVTGFIKADPEQISLDEAEVIVAGGRGLGSPENFQLLKELAKHLGGIVAGSLGAVDQGWLPRKKLVGQTGTTVAPKLYIACGISGSIYHTLGMKDSETIIAINTDCHAPIFKLADVGIVGDILEVVPAITSKLKGIIKSNTQVNKVSDIFSTL